MYNILIVDDMLINRRLMKKVLEKSMDNNVFFQASNGFEALECIMEESIDLIILDLMMPEKNGYDVLKEIKANSKYKDIPVIVNSAITDMQSIKETLELGAIDYFTKPITPEQMEIVIPLKARNALKYYEQKKELKKINCRVEKELRLAAILQKSLLDSYKSKNFEDVEVHTLYQSCYELGGDLFEFTRQGDNYWFIIADVTGHGVSSSMVSFMLKAVFNNIIQQKSSPSEVVKEINITFFNMLDDISNICFTAFVGVIKNRALTYSNAGHPYPIILRANKSLSIDLVLNGYIAGAFKDADYEEKTIDLMEDDCILLYTDGLYEGRGTNKNVGVLEVNDRIKAIYDGTSSLESFIEDLYYHFAGEENTTNDDIGIMAIRIK